MSRSVSLKGTLLVAVVFTAMTSIAGCADSTGSKDAGVGGPEGTECLLAAPSESLASCSPAAGDFLPREPGVDTWPACPADDGTVHLIGPGTPASAARTEAFDAMAQLLWANVRPLTAQDFVAARDLYSTAGGIGSRVERRQDVHYPEVPGDDKFACSNAGVPDQYPDRCAGPARVLPIVLDAFARGIVLDQPRVQAERLEAALIWFFYLSSLSEIWTSGIDDIADADSVWGYFDGARDRSSPIGLGATIAGIGPGTFDRAMDGVLAVNCWRSLDTAMPLSNVDLYTRALGQLDRALVRGVALILRERTRRIGCAAGQYRDAHLEFARVLGGFLDRESTARDAAHATTIRTELAKPAANLDTGKVIAALNALYACP